MKSPTPGRFAIALVQPSRPLNIGYVARTMGNFGLERLYIVNSKKNLTPAAVKFASHVPFIVSKSTNCSFDELRSKFRILIGSTAIEGVSSSNIPRTTIDPKELAAKIAGFEIEGTTAMLGQLANAGIYGSMAGTALRKIFLELSNESSKLSFKSYDPQAAVSARRRCRNSAYVPPKKI